MRSFLLKRRLKAAIGKGDADTVAELLPGFLDLNKGNPAAGEDLLFEAADHSLYLRGPEAGRIIGQLLDAGIAPDARRRRQDRLAYTPLSLVVLYHADAKDLPTGLSPDLKWLYAVNRDDWSHGAGSPRIGYHPEVLEAFLAAGADPFLAPAARDFSVGLRNWYLDKSTVGSLLREVARHNRNPNLLERAGPAAPGKTSP